MIAVGASASTASQREYKRGYADCKAGRWDENQHGSVQFSSAERKTRTRASVCGFAGDLGPLHGGVVARHALTLFPIQKQQTAVLAQPCSNCVNVCFLDNALR